MAKDVVFYCEGCECNSQHGERTVGQDREIYKIYICRECGYEEDKKIVDFVIK